MKTFFRSVSVFLLFLGMQAAFSPAQAKSSHDSKTASKQKPAKPNSEAPKPAAKENQKTAATTNNEPTDPLANLKFRNLGPAVGGGRVTAVVGIPGKPNIYYVGAPVAEFLPLRMADSPGNRSSRKNRTSSIGAIALAPSNSQPHLGRHRGKEHPQ